MNKSDLIGVASRETGLSVKKAEEVVNTVFKGMTEALANDERVEIRGFGGFAVKQYDGYQGRNPRTGEIVNVKPKKILSSSAGKS